MSFGPEILDQAEAGLQLLHVRSLPAPIQSNSTSEQTVALDLGNSRLMTRIDGIIILDQNGRPLITSHFPLHPPSYPSIHIDTLNHAIKKSRASDEPLDPVLWVNTLSKEGMAVGTGLCHVEREGLRFLVPIGEEVNPLFAFAFLDSFLRTLEDYLSDVTEINLKENFDTVYMLIEEMLDEGHPMTTETAMLKDIVLPPTLMRRLLNVAGVSGAQSPASAPFMAPIPWRRPNIRHANNEIFFDQTESMDAIIDPRGNVVSSTIWGRIDIRSRLSGNPDLLLTVSDPKVLTNCSFHPCIRYSKWEKSSTLSFIPPDGQFSLLDYQVPPMRLQLPLELRTELSTSEGGGQFSLTLMSRTNQKPITDISISIDLGDSCASVSATASGDRKVIGQAHGPGVAGMLSSGHGTTSRDEGIDGQVGGGVWEYDPHTHILKWSLSSLTTNERPPTLTGSFVASDHPSPSPSFNLSFEILNHSFSGMKVDQLKVFGDVMYKPFKGVRQVAKSGRMEVRW